MSLAARCCVRSSVRARVTHPAPSFIVRYAALAIVLFLACFSVIHMRAISVDWGDVSQALIYHQVGFWVLPVGRE